MSIISTISGIFSKPKPMAKQLTYVEKIVARLEDLETLSDVDDRLKSLELKAGIPTGNAP